MNRTTAPALAGSAAAALLVVGVLSGCAPSPVPTSSSASAPGPSSPTEVATPTASATPTPTPTPTGPPVLPANALFSIYATVTASDGASGTLYQVVYKPVSPDAADTALLNKECNYPGQPDFKGQPKWQSGYPSPLYLTTDITTTLDAGSPAWKNTKDGVLFWFLGAPGAFSGSYAPWEAACDSGFTKIPGTIHGVAPVPSSNPTGGSLGWAGSMNNQFGFIGGGNAVSNDDLGGTALIKNCVVQLSPEAKAANSKVAAWPTKPFTLENGCTFRA